MIDQDQDGFIDADDLKEIFTSLGADPNDDFVNEMIAEAPGKIIKGPQTDSGNFQISYWEFLSESNKMYFRRNQFHNVFDIIWSKYEFNRPSRNT